MSLLEVADLHTHFIARGLDNRIRVARALNGVSFTLEAGRTLGLVGETGAGKSLTALSIMGLLRPPARIVAGTIRFAGRDLTAAGEDELGQLRGGSMALIVQSPRTALDPLTRVGDQLVAVRRAHSRDDATAARERALAMLAAVGIPDPARRMAAWPHELSGGMAQRVLIAMALINEPKLLIADEPTTGLDVTVQAQVLDLLRGLVRDKGIGAIIITHDLGIVAHYCDDVAVMYAGGIVESGPVRQVFATPCHPYTRGLIASTPERFQMARFEIEGARRTGAPPPDLYALPAGCHFRDRCPEAAALCEQPPPWIALAEGHGARCHFTQRHSAERKT